MHNLLSTIFIVSLTLVILVTNTNISTHARTAKYVKEDLEVAVHDASLMIDEQQYAKGLVVINETRAKDEFKNSLKLNSGLEPTDYEILDFKIMDSSNTTFPVQYKLNGSNFEETIESPTVVVAIKVFSKDYFHVFTSEPVTRIASYSYKVRNKETPTTPIINVGTPSSYGLLWSLPYTTNITSHFSPQRVNPVTGQLEWHLGMDIAQAGVLNQPIVAVKNGTVTFSGVMGSYGNMIEISHDGGLKTRYAHLNTRGVTSGMNVTSGQIIGTVGSTGVSTGAHLHFETILNGVHVNPLNFYDR